MLIRLAYCKISAESKVCATGGSFNASVPIPTETPLSLEKTIELLYLCQTYCKSVFQLRQHGDVVNQLKKGQYQPQNGVLDI